MAAVDNFGPALGDRNIRGTIGDPNIKGLLAMARRKRDDKTKDLFAYAEDNRASIVYMATNTVNGKRYIGITRLTLDKRRECHFMHARMPNGRAQHFYRAIRKHGESAFAFAIVVHCDSYKAAGAEERRLIAQLQPEYNKTEGGEGILGHRHNAETRRKMSAAKNGKSPWPTGQYPAEVRAKLAASARARKGTFRYTEAQKAVMRANARKANEARRRPVVCLTDGLAFKGTIEAGEYYGLTSGQVSYLAQGRFNSRRGLRFAYAEDVWL